MNSIIIDTRVLTRVYLRKNLLNFSVSNRLSWVWRHYLSDRVKNITDASTYTWVII